jgi:hypothetical protein
MAETKGRECKKEWPEFNKEEKGGYKKEKKKGGSCDFPFFPFSTFIIYVSPLFFLNYWLGYRRIKLDNWGE